MHPGYKPACLCKYYDNRKTMYSHHTLYLLLKQMPVSSVWTWICCRGAARDRQRLQTRNTNRNTHIGAFLARLLTDCGFALPRIVSLSYLPEVMHANNQSAWEEALAGSSCSDFIARAISRRGQPILDALTIDARWPGCSNLLRCTV
jgi:hypothetical protein